jgi:SHS2 domain-containing protein
MAASHEVLEHTAEVQLRVRGPGLGELLAEAGRALAAVELGEETGVPSSAWRTIVIRSSDREALLVDWLNELIYLAEAERWIPVEFEIERADPHELRMRARGMQLAHLPSTVKAATHHGLAIRETEGSLEADVILDV